jgi:hypothetical protein
METYNKKLYFHFAIYTFFITFYFTAGLLWGESKSLILTQEQLKKEIKARYKYEEWKPRSDGVIQGVAISKETLEELKFTLKVWEKDDYNILTMKGVPNPIVIIRNFWAENNDQVEVIMAVGHTFDEVKEFLISQYYGTQDALRMVRISGNDLDLKIGDVCFVTPGGKAGPFSGVDFVRNNVVIMMKASGHFKIKLKKMAIEVDRLLKENGTVPSYSCFKEIPYVTLSGNQEPINVGMSVFLMIPDKKLRYFWKLTGGGIEKDPEENFVYYAGDVGPQTITVTAVNELGLQHSDTIKIEVKR